mmetsp:Transcript_52073/g.91492  ORF Transcript_52073/g.91492 Transcript_52073/m.91492 type:complete len:297 (+) Transcript_52073:106-996(+)
MRLLHSFAFVAAVTVAAVTNWPSDDSACSASGEDVDQAAGGCSMIQRQSSFQEVKLHRDLAESLSHRNARNNFLLQLVGNNISKAELSLAVQELQSYLEALGFPDFGKEGHVVEVGELAQQTAKYDEWANLWNFRTVCETGFNAGDSALRFLAQTDAQVYEFDLCEHQYSRPAADYLDKKFPNRLHLTCGDSMKTLPEFRKRYNNVKCDLVIIDGGHSLEVATADLQNLALMAHENALVVIDDAPCTASWCEGPTEAWKEFVDNGCIVAPTEIGMNPYRGFSYGLLKSCTLMMAST